MNVNPNPWTIESVITHAKEMTERNGFELLPGEGGVIKIVAKKPPYGRNVTIARLNDWASIELFFLGYEQGKMETNIVATLAKGKKAKPKEQPALTEEEFRVYCKGSDKRPRDVVLDAPLQMIAKATGWQGLTDAEIEEFENMELGTHDLCLEIEAKLQEKNGG